MEAKPDTTDIAVVHPWCICQALAAAERLGVMYMKSFC